jgi:hypothetical protein
MSRETPTCLARLTALWENKDEVAQPKCSAACSGDRATTAARRLSRSSRAFAVDGRPELGMVVYNPATRTDADRIRAFIAAPSV